MHAVCQPEIPIARAVWRNERRINMPELHCAQHCGDLAELSVNEHDQRVQIAGHWPRAYPLWST